MEISMPRHRFLLVALIVLLTASSLWAQIPTITLIAPASSDTGATIVISGTNFSAIASDNLVMFGPVAAHVISSSTTQLHVRMPAGATFDNVRVEVHGLTAISH